MSTIVIGAGPAGLTAAYELSRLGLPATVLEADDHLGGLSRTVDYRGYRFDIGGHRFFSKVPLVNELWHEILGGDFLLRPRLSRIHYRERFYDYPLRPLEALAKLGPIETLLVCASYAKARVFPVSEESNFEQWVSNRFGRRLYEIFFKTYTEKVWGVPCTEISADWAAQRIKNLSLSEAVRSAFHGTGRTRDGEVISTLIDRFHYPRLGPGMMWQRCAELLAARGVETIRDRRVERIVHRDGRVERVVTRTAAGEAVEFGGEQFIATMPVRELVSALDPPPPADVLRAANALRHRDYLTVVLIVRRADVFPDNWLYVHSPEVRLGRIQNYKNWSPAMVPDASRTSLGLEYFLWQRDEEWSWPDERLVELGMRDCTRINLVDPAEVEDATVVRATNAYPVYDHAYARNLATVRHYLAGLPNLQLIGRNGQHRYNNQDHSMLAGVYAARNVAGERHDVWAVNTEAEYHEAGVVDGRVGGQRLAPASIAPVPGAAVTRAVEAAFAPLDSVALAGAFGTVAALVLFLATVVLLLRGGPVVGPNLALLAQYLPGFSVTWRGAFVGLGEAALGGFGVGWAIATLRNAGLSAYAALVARQSGRGLEGSGGRRVTSRADEMSRAVARIHAGVLAVVCGLVGGAGVFVMTGWLLVKGGPHTGSHLQLLGQYFYGYSVTWAGSLIGFVWGAVVGGAVGWTIGRVYNGLVDLRA